MASLFNDVPLHEDNWQATMMSCNGRPVFVPSHTNATHAMNLVKAANTAGFGDHMLLASTHGLLADIGEESNKAPKGGSAGKTPGQGSHKSNRSAEFASLGSISGNPPRSESTSGEGRNLNFAHAEDLAGISGTVTEVSGQSSVRSLAINVGADIPEDDLDGEATSIAARMLRRKEKDKPLTARVSGRSLLGIAVNYAMLTILPLSHLIRRAQQIQSNQCNRCGLTRLPQAKRRLLGMNTKTTRRSSRSPKLRVV